MKRRLTLAIIGAACTITPITVLPMGAAQAQSVNRPNEMVELSIGRGRLVTVPGTMADIFVANDTIADVQVKSQRQLYVFGKAGGETTVYASNASGAVIWSANVRVGSNIDSIDQMLSLAMPEAKIGVATMSNNTVLLTGTVAAPEDAAEAERLVKAYMGEGANVISRLKMATPLQVNLRVRFAEVSRSLVRNLGVNLASADSSSGFQFGIGQGRQGWLPQYTPRGPVGTGVTEGGDGTSVITNIAGGTTISGLGKFLGLDLVSALDLAETNGLVTTLAQPNLTALSGETADFLAGGEFPIPLAQGLGTTSIEYKKYGISLAYTPTVLANGRISIRVRPEVSELSSQGAVIFNGTQVPALTVRRAETTVELGSGQSFMIAGLLNNNAQNAIQKAPGVGDLPILGALFRSTEFRKGQTELVIVVTPYLVNPVNDRDIKLPTDGFRAPTAFEQFMGNMESRGVTGGTRPLPTTDPETPTDPTIGYADDALLAPSKPDLAGSEKSRGKSRKPSRKAKTAATPGFSLN
ncbi:Flp pilus assembly protein [Caenibius tardaugens NBRC 16725]|uniref:Flp pilus assembly protein n=1 Tax=Caenibius tardaugens NBRC 16725 TaxID=1219035 RepID=U2YLC0_9SPHN|nr:type II and III secretion system protein family protein [Caenibius tardaugens]AZI36757.1 type II and III secretion system protein family protein [Caenibius tardaugens NBRC 16725]GAD49430.1 Flp pilus assembly protein [Caenibius tardaugens NBRC 16725]